MLALAIVVTLLAAILFVYSVAVRPWHLQWGATHLDRVAQLPGDELSPHAPGHITRAIAIDAPPEAVWPALEKAVEQRAAQSGMVVAVSHPAQGMALATKADWERIQAKDEALDAVQAFYIKPLAGGKTRLLARLRFATFPTMAARAADLLGGEMAYFFAERRMLTAIKEQAEKRA